MGAKDYIRRVNYYETDQMGVVHHSNYIRWFEEARVDMMKQFGLDYRYCEEIGLMMPVLSVSCEYKSSVKFDEVITITSKILEFNGYKMSISYEVRNLETGVLRSTGLSKHCFLNNEFKPVKLKKEFSYVYEKLKLLTT